jgi:hypothetical protein
MEKMKIMLILVLIALTTQKLKDTVRNGTREIEFKGMTFVGDKYCPEVSYEDPDAIVSLSNLKATGANWVAIVVTEYQDFTNSTKIYPQYGKDITHNEYFTYKTETIEGLRRVIEAAHIMGLKVMLKPHIDLSKEPRYNVIWRGNIGEDFTSQQQWHDWFASYEKFIVKYAELAERLNVEMFSISCELIAVSKMDHYWRRVIYAVKQVYSGLLTDSANHDGEEWNKTWWKEMDYIGVDAYYLPIKSNDTIKVMKDIDEQLEGISARLTKLAKQWGKNIIITEVGFCSGNCLRGEKVTPFDQYMQAYFYESFIRIFQKNEYVKGYFWWAWNSDPNFGGMDDTCISPQNKLAEGVLRLYYGADQTLVNYYPSKGKAKCICTI